MATFNAPADLRRVLNSPSGDNEYTDAELQEYLDEANNDFRAQIKRFYEKDTFDTKVDSNTGNVVDDYTLSLTPVISVYKVFVNSELKTLTTDYTYDTTDQKLEFVDGVLKEGNTIEVQYIPQIYQLIELYMAAANALLRTNLVDENGESNPVLLNYQKKVDMYMNLISSRTLVGTFT